MKTFAKIIITVLGVTSLSGCQHQEENVTRNSNVINKENYLDLLEESMNTVFNDTYKDITINTSFVEMAHLFEVNSKDFFLNKGFIVSDADMACARSAYNGSLDYMAYLCESDKLVVEEVFEILQLPNYKDVRSGISQLYDRIQNEVNFSDRENTLRYIEFIEKMLVFLEKENGKFDVLNVLAKYNEFHEIKIVEMPTVRDRVPLSDGMYPHPTDKTKYIMVHSGYVFELSCSNGLVYSYTHGGCVWSDGGSNKDVGTWWNQWGRCTAAILGGAGGGTLAGGSAGSVMPGLGTLAGAIIGALSGALTGAVAGC